MPRRICTAGVAVVILAFIALASTGRAQAPPPKQAVVETSAGTFVLDLLPEAAPNTVAFFMKTAEAGGYNGTAFHRAVRNGMVQGGDPLSKDPAKRAQYGTGRIESVEGRSARAEDDSPDRSRRCWCRESLTAQARSSSSCSPTSRRSTISTRSSRRWRTAWTSCRSISAMPVGRVRDDRGSRRDPEGHDPRYAAGTLRQRHAAAVGCLPAVLDTSAGPITIEFFADKAPETVRQFLRMADAGVYNGMAFHRVAPGFVIQTGALSSRTVAAQPEAAGAGARPASPSSTTRST